MGQRAHRENKIERTSHPHAHTRSHKAFHYETEVPSPHPHTHTHMPMSIYFPSTQQLGQVKRKSFAACSSAFVQRFTSLAGPSFVRKEKISPVEQTTMEERWKDWSFGYDSLERADRLAVEGREVQRVVLLAVVSVVYIAVSLRLLCRERGGPDGGVHVGLYWPVGA